MPLHSFHAWPRLATELKVLVLKHALQDDINSLRATPLYHQWYMQRRPLWSHNWLVGRINSIIATRNREIVDLALDICEYPCARLECLKPAHARARLPSSEEGVLRRAYYLSQAHTRL